MIHGNKSVIVLKGTNQPESYTSVFTKKIVIRDWSYVERNKKMGIILIYIKFTQILKKSE